LICVSSEELFSVNYHFDPKDDDSKKGDEALEKLEKTLNTLNPRQKETVYLRYKMDLSY
jgi:DNA-directed RNA polymerase specialized sigma24 family protein